MHEAKDANPIRTGWGPVYSGHLPHPKDGNTTMGAASALAPNGVSYTRPPMPAEDNAVTPTLSNQIERLVTLNEVAWGLAQRAHQVADLFVGPAPRGEPPLSKAPEGAVHTMEAFITMTYQSLDSLSHALSRLESGLK